MCEGIPVPGGGAIPTDSIVITVTMGENFDQLFGYLNVEPC